MCWYCLWISGRQLNRKNSQLAEKFRFTAFNTRYENCSEVNSKHTYSAYSAYGAYSTYGAYSGLTIRCMEILESMWDTDLPTTIPAVRIIFSDRASL